MRSTVLGVFVVGLFCGMSLGHYATAQSPGRAPEQASTASMRQAVAVGSVTGPTRSPSSLFRSDLTARGFETALGKSLMSAGLAAEGGSPRYRLDAHVEHVDYPSGTFVPIAVSVRSIVRYRLVEIATGREVLATTSDATATTTRVEFIDETQRANAAIERSARANIARLLAMLGTVQR